jgi:hypothetical protein
MQGTELLFLSLGVEAHEHVSYEKTEKAIPQFVEVWRSIHQPGPDYWKEFRIPFAPQRTKDGGLTQPRLVGRFAAYSNSLDFQDSGKAGGCPKTEDQPGRCSITDH